MVNIPNGLRGASAQKPVEREEKGVSVIAVHRNLTLVERHAASKNLETVPKLQSAI